MAAQPLATYVYDGDGKRVRKTASGFEDTVFLYDAGGTLIEERNVSTGAITNYVYAGSQLISTETVSGTSYITADHLGSTRGRGVRLAIFLDISGEGSGSGTAILQRLTSSILYTALRSRLRE